MALGLLAPGSSAALEIFLVNEVLGVDTIAQVINSIDPARIPSETDDPPPLFSTIATQSATANVLDTRFTDPDTLERSVRFGEAVAEAVNVGVDIPTAYLFNSSAVIGGNGDPFLEESATAEAFGTVDFIISDAGSGPGTEAFVEIGFNEAVINPPPTQIGIGSASVLLHNLTLGTILFDSAVDGFPTNVELASRVGDLMRLEWTLAISGDIPDHSARGEVGLEGRFEVIALGEPVNTPEPSVALLAAAIVPPLLARRLRVRS